MARIRSVLLLCFVILTTLVGCEERASNEANLVTIEYAIEPPRTFRISGTDIEGVKFEQLTEVLKKHKAEHPDASYQFIAEIKSVRKTTDAIQQAIRDAGIELKHYWIPVSDLSPDEFDNPNAGRVDLVGNKK